MTKWLLSCEHGGNGIPVEFSSAFLNSEKLINSHRGYDIGVSDLFSLLKIKDFFDYSIINNYSRLLVDFNRSLNNKNLFSEISGLFSAEAKDQLLNRYYHPYRNKVKAKVLKWLDNGFDVVHVSLHSFTPVFNGIQRNCDLGILYDPRRSSEKHFAIQMKKKCGIHISSWKIRFNYPYKGTSDGHVQFFRKNLSVIDSRYTGIELELNQKIFKALGDWEKYFLDAFRDIKGDFKKWS